ncbi:MAG: hypothetical protein Kow0065_24840 [Methylomicrobium sp.]
MSDFLRLTVGERFNHDTPSEGMSVILANGTPLLTFNFALTPKQIDAFLNGTCSFGLLYENDVLFFLFKIENFLEWSDLAFTTHLAGDETVATGPGYLPFNLVLTDSSTKIIKGLRVVTTSPNFASTLANATQEQAKRPFDTLDYYKKIGQLYEKYPSAAAMLHNALVVEKGGITLPND